MSELNTEIPIGGAWLNSSFGRLPIATIGEGWIVSRSPLYVPDIGTSFLIYATLHDSHTYGNPAFWFGETDELMPLVEFVEPQDASTLLLTPEDIVLRKVSVWGDNVEVDNTGLARYHFDPTNMQDDLDRYLIHPDGYA